MRRGIAAGQCRRTQMSHPLKALNYASGEHFAAPDAAIVTVACTVEAYSHYFPLEFTALGQNGRHMCAVVLYGMLFPGRQLLRVLAAKRIAGARRTPP